MLLELDGTGFTNWCSRIRSVLELTGLDQAWETQHIGNKNKCMLYFKDSTVRIFTQRWRRDIKSSIKLRTYSLVKKIFVCGTIHLKYKGEPPHNSNGEISNELTRFENRQRTIQQSDNSNKLTNMHKV